MWRDAPEGQISMKRLQVPANDLYEADFYAWTAQQAAFIRTGKQSSADWQHSAEEVENMGKREKRELASRTGSAVARFAEMAIPTRPTRQQLDSDHTRQRIKIADDLEDNPSLRSVLPTVLDHAI